ncbi:MAG TPA: hypothetical protein VGK73_18130 [Polyangiaceae bacterium]
MFKSFYMAGFECATGKNAHAQWIDQIAATEHERFVDTDYALLAGCDIFTLREGVRWPLVDRSTGYDFSSLDAFVAAARRYEMEVLWDLFHFGYPDRFDPFSANFPAEFARYCGAVARHVCRELPGPYYFTPVNEGSYFAHAAGEIGCFAPHARGRGHELKVCLARAALAGVRAIREACPAARFVSVDPICHVVEPFGADGAFGRRVREFNHEVVFQFMDILAGRLMPELGGSRDCLDIVGVNYYWTNQWELGDEQRPLALCDPRRLPVSALVRRVARRYGGSVLLSETGQKDEARSRWIDELSSSSIELLADGYRFEGVCLYPVLGMSEWHDRERWTRMGLWDLLPAAKGLERVPHWPALDALARAQRGLERYRAASVSMASTG